jgi:hypothetical protein
MIKIGNPIIIIIQVYKMHSTMLNMMILAAMLVTTLAAAMPTAMAMSTVTTSAPELTGVNAKLVEVNDKLAVLTAKLATANTSIKNLRNSNFYQGGKIIEYWLKGKEYTQELVDPIEMYTLTNNRRVRNLELMVYISVSLIVIAIIVALVITQQQRQQLRAPMAHPVETIGGSDNVQEPTQVPTRASMEARL